MNIFARWFIGAALLGQLMLAQGNDGNVTASNVLSLSHPQVLTIKPGSTAESRLWIKIVPGYHVNSNTPSDPFLIGLRLTWEAEALGPVEVVYPKAETAKLSFSGTPASVFTGEFDIVMRVRVPDHATPGTAVLNGKLRYQACNDRMCLPPKTVAVALPVEIVKQEER